jgi:hypothetical protein
MARYWALVGDHARAFKALHLALDLNYADVEFWQEEELNAIRSDPDFAAVEAVVKKRLAGK